MQTQQPQDLADIHFKRIGCRSLRTFEEMTPLWGCSWNLRGQTMLSLGKASLMGVSYHVNYPKPSIEAVCVVAQSNPATGEINYDDIRMSHDLRRAPVPGARDRVLDPREETLRNVAPGDRPNASWLRLGLQIDQHVYRAVYESWRLPVVPKLPVFWAGYKNPEAVPLMITPSLIADIAQHLRTTPAAVKALDKPLLDALAKAHWPEVFVAPDVEWNDTGLWLIRTEYLTNFTSKALFEDFTGMIGVEVWNPARDLALQFGNPTRRAAASLNIDIDAAIAAINAGGHEASSKLRIPRDPYYNGYKAKFGATVPAMTACFTTGQLEKATDAILRVRELVAAAFSRKIRRKISTDELNFAVLNPDAEIVEESTLADYREDYLISLVREQLRGNPLINSGTTDADICQAVYNLREPLVASRVCRPQVLVRHTGIDPAAAFNFPSTRLERPGVTANLWAGEGWYPRVKVKQREKVSTYATR